MTPMPVTFLPDFWLGRSPQCANRASPEPSGITMPPVHGFVLWRIYEIAGDKQRVPRLSFKEMYPQSDEPAPLPLPIPRPHEEAVHPPPVGRRHR